LAVCWVAVFWEEAVTVGWPFERLLLQRGVRPSKLTIVLNSADPEIFPEEHRIPPRTTPPTQDLDVQPQRGLSLPAVRHSRLCRGDGGPVPPPQEAGADG